MIFMKLWSGFFNLWNYLSLKIFGMSFCKLQMGVLVWIIVSLIYCYIVKLCHFNWKSCVHIFKEKVVRSVYYVLLMKYQEITERRSKFGMQRLFFFFLLSAKIILYILLCVAFWVVNIKLTYSLIVLINYVIYICFPVLFLLLC